MLNKFFHPYDSNDTYDEGYEAPTTEGINTEIAELEMEALELEDDLLIQSDLPPVIKVRCLLEGVPVRRNRTQIQSVMNGTVYPSTSLYFAQGLEGKQQELLEVCQNEAVRLKFLHILEDPLDERTHKLPHFYSENEILFEKEFQTQVERNLLQRKTRRGNLWITIPPGHNEGAVNVLPVYCFGGCYKPKSTPLEHIIQSYFIISYEEDRTLQRLQTCGFWTSINCPPKDGGWMENNERVVFIDSQKTPQSLATDLQDGLLSFVICKDGIEYTYESFNFEQKNILSLSVDIHLKLKGVTR